MSVAKSERLHMLFSSEDVRNLELLAARDPSSNRSLQIRRAIRLAAVIASGEVCLAKKTPNGEFVEIPQKLLWL